MKRDAVAVLNALGQAGNMHVRDFGNGSVPCFNPGGSDSAFVKTVIERSAASGMLDDVRVKLTLQSETLSGLSAHSAIGHQLTHSSQAIAHNTYGLQRQRAHGAITNRSELRVQKGCRKNAPRTVKPITSRV